MNKNIDRGHMKVALVTGASSGIGKATAERLAKAGFKVYGTSRQGAQPEQANSIKMLQLDVTRDDSVAAAVNELIKLEGRIDLLVNNAGFSLAPAGAEESSTEQAKSVFDTNFFGTVRMTRAVLPHMRNQKCGRIINIGSIVGFLPAPYMAFYAASKHAIEGYSESLDHEVRQWGIRVSVLEPASTRTQIDANAPQADAMLDVYNEVLAIVDKQLTKMIDNGDEPGLVAEVVLKAATSAHPKIRYTVGRMASRLKLIRRFAPAGMFDSAIRREMKLNSLKAPR